VDPTRPIGADALVEALRGVVGAEHVLVDADLRAPYEVDWTGRFRGTARCVVRPVTTEQVARVLRVCARHHAPLVPQGGNTGLVGGSVPRGGEVVLSMRRLDDIGDVDDDHGEVVAGAGAPLAVVRHAARAAAWDVGVDMASRDSATIGGMVATNAGGLHLLRYGAMRHQVIGLEAVRADGEVLGRVPALRKDNTGYHWSGVLAGSEGTLAVVTRVHLALVPLLADRVVALFGVDDLGAALRVVGRLRRRLASLLAVEVCFADGVDLVCEHAGLPWPFPERAPVLLLVECGGPAGSADDVLASLSAVLGTAPEIRASAVATDEPGRERLWAYRERQTETISALGVPHKLDVTIPFRALAEFPERARLAVAAVAPDARVILFGHLGDGNLHVNVMGPAADDDTVDDTVLRLVAEVGGSISAEHGIGVAKRDFLPLSRSPADLAAMRDLKRAFDPNWLLNPGVLLEPDEHP
jgi:FAD/FMN-containing dehydrogenase